MSGLVFWGSTSQSHFKLPSSESVALCPCTRKLELPAPPTPKAYYTTGNYCREVHFTFSSMSGNRHPSGLAQWPFQSHSQSNTLKKHLTSTLHAHQPYRTTYTTMSSL